MPAQVPGGGSTRGPEMTESALQRRGPLISDRRSNLGKVREGGAGPDPGREGGPDGGRDQAENAQRST